MELISTKAIAIISLLFTLQTLYVQALEPRQIIWKAEETRRDVCQYIEDYAARACKNGPNLMNCCSVVAAYEATACSCELTAADLNAQKSLDEYMAFKYTVRSYYSSYTQIVLMKLCPRVYQTIFSAMCTHAN